MPPTYKSPAFLQQCFAVHPVSLTFKKIIPPDRIGVFCCQCKMRHRVTIQPAHAPEEASGLTPLLLCTRTHPESIRMSAIDREGDNIQFRCGECQHTTILKTALIETQIG